MSFTKFPLTLTTLIFFSILIFAHAHNTASIDSGLMQHQSSGNAINAYRGTFQDSNDPRMGTHFHVSPDATSPDRAVLAFRRPMGYDNNGNPITLSGWEQAPSGSSYVSTPILKQQGSGPNVKLTGDYDSDGRNDNTPESGVQVTFVFEDSDGDSLNQDEQTFTDEEGEATFTTLPNGTHSITSRFSDIEITYAGEVRNFLSAINADPPSQTQITRYDLNGDTVIDSADLFQWIMDQQNAAPAAVQTPHEWLQHIKELDNPDPTWELVIQLLEEQLIEKRLAEPAAKRTVLLANYPNPFNPETWIPYRLAKPADVTLTIYATNGQPVRRLTLGQQMAGNYANRARAAYWDGKNAFGEPVGSGVYFYTLTTDDFSATRKMLIAK